MHKVKVVRSNYEQSRPYVGQTGEVIGHWGPENSEDGRDDGLMVQFPDGNVVGITEDEVESVTE